MKFLSGRCEFISAIFATLVLVTGCSSGGGGGGATTPTTTSSFPNVVGNYSFNTGIFNMSCTDGSGGTSPALALNFSVTQNANQITIFNADAGEGIPGITIIDSTDLKGNVQTNGQFIATQQATANIDGIVGTVTLSYNLSGTITAGGWSGTYTYTATAPSLGGSCTFVGSFTGEKIVVGIVIERPIVNLEGLPPDIYDTFGHIARALAQ